MKKFIFQTLLLLIVIFVGGYLYLSGGGVLINQNQPGKDGKAKLQIGPNIFNVTIAQSKEEKSKGLGGKQMLATDEGMLFVYDTPDRYSYWMKGLLFPLDFVWIRSGKVVDLITNVPPPLKEQKDETLPIYKPSLSVDNVLELNGGIVEKLNIKVGDDVVRLK